MTSSVAGLIALGSWSGSNLLAPERAIVRDFLGGIDRRNKLIIDEEPSGDRNLFVESGDCDRRSVCHSEGGEDVRGNRNLRF